MRLFYFLLFLFSPLWSGQQTGGLQVPATELHGVDVSHYQKKIEWDTVLAKQPLSFAFVKATEGGDYTDSLFCSNWDQLERLNVRRGAYHFFRSYGCGYEQAMHFLKTVEFRPGDLAPVLDVETTDDIPTDQMLEQIGIWLYTVEKTLGIKPIIYTNQNFYERHLAGAFDNNPLWIARYSDERPCLSTGKRWDIWQYSNEGCLDGIPKQVDLNVFAGDASMLDRLCWFPQEVIPATAEAVLP